METASNTDAAGEGPITDQWCAHHFDYLSPQLARDLHPTLARMRSLCPVAHSDQYGGYWIATKYEEVLAVAQDWETFSSELGVAIKPTKMTVRALPEHVDPPLQRTYKRLINAYFTPAAVAPYEAPTRRLVTSLIDEFIEAGRCDFFTQFARPFPGLAFFELALNAPADEVTAINDLVNRATSPGNPEAASDWAALHRWINEFAARRRAEPPKGDVVDAILGADIDGRPVTDEEILGLILLLILGGLETTAGALGQFMIRFCQEPQIPSLLRRQPELIPAAVEELLRLDGPFLGIGRTARHDGDIGGQPIRQGEKVVIYFASANRDEDEFAGADSFDLGRERNRHLSFGAGPHRCAGSSLARLNLRIAVQEVVTRLEDLALAEPADSIPFHSAFNRSPLRVPVRFTPGPRLGAAAS